MDSSVVRKYWRKIGQALKLNKLSPGVRRLVVGIAGTVVLLLGLAMIFLPGPAVVMIPLGLAILGSEFRWARAWLHKAIQMFREGRAKFRRRKAAHRPS
jgi:uncharacterized protein (TIGR02611 family)